MMGYGHAAMGAAGFLTLTSTSALAIGVAPQAAPVMAVGALLTAGAALLPDLDHHSGTIAHAVPSVEVFGVTLIPSPTKALARVVEDVSGGHRHLTHSLLGIAAATVIASLLSLLHLPATAVTWLAARVGWHLDPADVGGGHGVNVGVLLMSVLLVAFAVKALRMNKISGNDLGSTLMRTWIGPWVMGLAVGVYAGAFLRLNWFIWLPALVALGTFIHCLGDTLTTQGVAWFQPWQGPAPERVRAAAADGNPLARFITWCWPPNGYLRVPILGTAGSLREHLLNIALILYSLLLLGHDVAAALSPGLTHWLI